MGRFFELSVRRGGVAQHHRLGNPGMCRMPGRRLITANGAEYSSKAPCCIPSRAVKPSLMVTWRRWEKMSMADQDFFSFKRTKQTSVVAIVSEPTDSVLSRADWKSKWRTSPHFYLDPDEVAVAFKGFLQRCCVVFAKNFSHLQVSWQTLRREILDRFCQECTEWAQTNLSPSPTTSNRTKMQ